MSNSTAAPRPIDRERLAALAGRLLPNGREIRQLRRWSGGASQETWALDVEQESGPIGLILRHAPGGSFQHETAAGLETEAAVIAAVAVHGVPVPPIRHVLVPGDGLGRGFFTLHVEGETIARKILRDDAFAEVRPHLPAAFARSSQPSTRCGWPICRRCG